jgi:hypothetical protein
VDRDGVGLWDWYEVWRTQYIVDVYGDAITNGLCDRIGDIHDEPHDERFTDRVVLEFCFGNNIRVSLRFCVDVWVSVCVSI